MAVTFTLKHYSVFGNKRIVIGDLAFDSSYASGGEPLTAATLGLDVIDTIIPATSGGYLMLYDTTNAVMHAYWIGVGANSTSATANNELIKGSGGAIEVAGSGSAFGNALSEVTATTDLSALTAVRIVAIGS